MSVELTNEVFCRECGYDLRGQSACRCSECGVKFDPQVPRSYRSGKVSGIIWLWTALGWVVINFIFLAVLVALGERAVDYLSVVTALFWSLLVISVGLASWILSRILQQKYFMSGRRFAVGGLMLVACVALYWLWQIADYYT